MVFWGASFGFRKRGVLMRSTTLCPQAQALLLVASSRYLLKREGWICWQPWFCPLYWSECLSATGACKHILEKETSSPSQVPSAFIAFLASLGTTITQTRVKLGPDSTQLQLPIPIIQLMIRLMVKKKKSVEGDVFNVVILWKESKKPRDPSKLHLWSYSYDVWV